MRSSHSVACSNRTHPWKPAVIKIMYRIKRTKGTKTEEWAAINQRESLKRPSEIPSPKAWPNKSPFKLLKICFFFIFLFYDTISGFFIINEFFAPKDPPAYHIFAIHQLRLSNFLIETSMDFSTVEKKKLYKINDAYFSIELAKWIWSALI